MEHDPHRISFKLSAYRTQRPTDQANRPEIRLTQSGEEGAQEEEVDTHGIELPGSFESLNRLIYLNKQLMAPRVPGPCGCDQMRLNLLCSASRT